MAVPNSRRVFPAACPGMVLGLQAASAFASGREGAAYVGAVFWIVAVVLVTFAILVLGGGLRGALRAARSGKSMLKGGAIGLWKGVITFLVVSVVSLAALTVLGILWIAYSFLDVYVLHPSS